MSVPAGIAVTLDIAYPYRVELQIDWPVSVRYERHDYIRTGKLGTNIASGLPAAEYRYVGRPEPLRQLTEARLWLLCDGTIVPD